MSGMFRIPLENGTTLRLLEKHHAPALFAAIERDRAALREWLPWLDRTTEVAHTEAFIELTRKQWGENQGFQAAIWQDEQLVGMIGFHAIHWANRKTSIGYWLATEFQGRGIMTRACREMLRLAFEEWRLTRVEIRCASGNARSQAVATRLGFTREGVARKAEHLYGQVVDHVVFGMTDEDWATKAKSSG